ncbi:uncharacterized protein LOC116417905 [Nasonia vitripennis]|uniref:Uncharacterized protein n=1 Tax=Nasonia vitripennis TaxID=7425 RepID=A0A7M7TBB5_NASVI|nr:uncharacterized protein LOC116417905 [Nasonia vitripennis]
MVQERLVTSPTPIASGTSELSIISEKSKDYRTLVNQHKKAKIRELEANVNKNYTIQIADEDKNSKSKSKKKKIKKNKKRKSSGDRHTGKNKNKKVHISKNSYSRKTDYEYDSDKYNNEDQMQDMTSWKKEVNGEQVSMIHLKHGVSIEVSQWKEIKKENDQLIS